MVARNRVGIGLSYRLARLHRVAESVPGLLKSLKIACLDTEKIKDSEPEELYVAHLVPDVRTEGGVLLLGYLTGEAAEDIL